ncbi:unnamed protein product [Cyprideis torosa]|uniref:Uncharacterized protein n=1 Tax=Cyprideis torosa TaxID=163714 RepID=A0A7R8WM90_9CRUS|nr:unnamed protein product [Cyprideis torosa]CAG0905093.1 unnamed protein product [Cyprideis torosa]
MLPVPHIHSEVIRDNPYMGKAFWLLCFWQEFLPVPAPPSEEPQKNPHRGKTFRTFLLGPKISQCSNLKCHKKSIPVKCLSLALFAARVSRSFPVSFPLHEKIRSGDPYWEKPFSRSVGLTLAMLVLLFGCH